MSDSLRTEHKPIRPAASLLLVRDTHPGVQVLTLKRSEQMRFLPGFLSFPGGSLDAGDADAASSRWTGSILAAEQSDDIVYAAAAIRECAEEVGWLCAVLDHAGQTQLVALTGNEQRRLLSGEESFGDLLQQRALWIDGSRLRFVGRWVTPEHMSARFDTRFFVCACREQAPSTRLNSGENQWARWGAPAKLLEEIRAGSEQAVPPTIAMLRALREAPSCDEAMRSLSVPGPSAT